MMPDTKETGSDGTELELDDDGKDTTCPLCEEFEGPASSVQAHISGSTDSDHSGRIGKDVMSESSDSDSSETIEFPENPDATDPVDDDDELDEEANPNGDEVSNGSQTDEDGDVEDDDTEDGNDLTDVAVAVGAIVALVVFLRGGDFSIEQDPDVPEVMVL